MEKIGLQLYSVKQLTKKDFIGTLKTVAGMGYDGVEFAGFFGVTAKELKKVLKELNLQPCGSHTPVNLLERELDALIEYNLKIGNRYIICPALPEEMRDNESAWKKTAELFNKIGQKCRDSNIQFGYHNHAYEFEKFNGKYAFDILGENTDPELVFMEIDTYWVEYTGLRSVDFMKKYPDRLPLIHIKDMKSREERINTEVGNGVMDFVEISKLAKKYGTKWYIVEQEQFEIPQEESIMQSITYLKKIL